MAQIVKNLPAMRETWVQSLGWEDPLEEGMATDSSVLSWRIPTDREAWQAIVHGVTESDMTEQEAQHSTSVLLACNQYKNGEQDSLLHFSSSVQFSSVAQSCPTLCDHMNHIMPGLPVHHQLPKFTQTHVHRVGDAIQPSHSLSSTSPPASNHSQHQSLFQ